MELNYKKIQDYGIYILIFLYLIINIHYRNCVNISVLVASTLLCFYFIKSLQQFLLFHEQQQPENRDNILTPIKQPIDGKLGKKTIKSLQQFLLKQETNQSCSRQHPLCLASIISCCTSSISSITSSSSCSYLDISPSSSK